MPKQADGRQQHNARKIDLATRLLLQSCQRVDAGPGHGSATVRVVWSDGRIQHVHVEDEAKHK